MSRTTYVCTGCGTELVARRDLTMEQGTVYATWLCRYCRTRVPGVVAERIRDQRQH